MKPAEESSSKFDVICHIPQIGVCGLKCKHCWVTHNLKKNKPLDEIKMMIDGLAELRDTPSLADLVILYFIDELILHPDVIEILHHCRKRDVLPQQTLVTNGHGLVDREDWEEILAELKKCGLKRLLMAVNGDEEYHDWFTGVSGSFRKTLKATKRANEYGFDVIWNMYLTNENVDQVCESARAKGDDRIMFGVPVYTTKWVNWHPVHLEVDTLSRIPDDCSQYMRKEIKSEAEWIRLFTTSDDTQLDQWLGKPEKEIKVGGFYECNGQTYKDITLPEYRVGPVDYSNLRDLYSSYPVPPGVKLEETMNLKEMALKYGDPSSMKAFTLNGIKKKFMHCHSAINAISQDSGD